MPKLQYVHLLTTKQGRVGTRDKTELGFSRVSMYAIPVISSATPGAIPSQSRLLWEDSLLDYRLRNRKYDKRGRQYVNIRVRATTDILIHRTTLILAVVKVALFLTCKSLVGLDEHCVVAFCEAHTVRKAAAARAQEVRKWATIRILLIRKSIQPRDTALFKSIVYCPPCCLVFIIKSHRILYMSWIARCCHVAAVGLGGSSEWVRSRVVLAPAPARSPTGD
jgi:hypothetical protein